jgi:uncharacterized protein YdeI (YjbR/CyaY-like superfamily)
VEPQFFATSADLRRWFEENRDKATELIVGYYKKGTDRATVTWAESVDEALCFGWMGLGKKGPTEVACK